MEIVKKPSMRKLKPFGHQFVTLSQEVLQQLQNDKIIDEFIINDAHATSFICRFLIKGIPAPIVCFIQLQDAQGFFFEYINRAYASYTVVVKTEGMNKKHVETEWVFFLEHMIQVHMHGIISEKIVDKALHYLFREQFSPHIRSYRHARVREDINNIDFVVYLKGRQVHLQVKSSEYMKEKAKENPHINQDVIYYVVEHSFSRDDIIPNRIIKKHAFRIRKLLAQCIAPENSS